MKIETTFLRSKVGKRIFTLFIFCALLPIAVLGVLSFTLVTKQLHEQARSRLHQASKATGMAILEKLLFLEGEMKMVASNLRAGSHPLPRTKLEELGIHLHERFKGIAVLTDSTKVIPIWGLVREGFKLTPEERKHVLSGGTLVSSKHRHDLSVNLFISLSIDAANAGRDVLFGEINPAYLWGIAGESPLPPMTEICILDDQKNLIFSSLKAPVPFSEEVMGRISSTSLGEFEWENGGKKYLAYFWTMFMKGMFFTPKWTVVMSEPKSHVLAPVANFRRIFPFVLLVALLFVLLLSIVQIRRNLNPLEKLREGMKRIAKRDFDSRVAVNSGDEFQELAASFNTMTAQLGKQFHALTTMGEIDRAILSALETEKITDVVLSRMKDVFPCDQVGVTLIDPSAELIGRTYITNGSPDHEKAVEMICLSREEMGKLMGSQESLIMEVDGAPPSYLESLARRGAKSFWVFPLVVKKKVSGMVALGFIKPPDHNEDDILQARRLANQMAVALSNAQLIKELNELNWGILLTLARAIDAKSPWTAGHSERVTKMALRIGRAIGLAPKEMEVMQRGGLLHDIGKLGIPPEILDKADKLSQEEEGVMREHVGLGTRILEPIVAYAEVIPIVSQHHEYFDGTGYPHGLAGENINFGARIFAVADCFDAMTSNRPYREALDSEYAVKTIKEAAGTQFDPEIVETFVNLMKEERKEGGGK